MSEQTFLLILSTTLVVIIVVLLSFLSAVLWQLVKIMREVRGIMANMRAGSDALTADLAGLRSHIKSFFLGQIASRFGASSSRKRKSAASRQTAASSESNPAVEE